MKSENQVMRISDLPISAYGIIDSFCDTLFMVLYAAMTLFSDTFQLIFKILHKVASSNFTSMGFATWAVMPASSDA